jgi:hypothetical protein
MPAKPLTTEQKEDAKRLQTLFKGWQDRRRERGEPFSQEVAAGLLEVGRQSAVSQYLLGKIPLNIHALSQFAKLIGCTYEAISPTLAAEIGRLGAHSAESEGAKTTADSSLISASGRDHKDKTTGYSVGAEKFPTPPNAAVPLLHHVGDSRNFRRVYVVGRAQGGLPERIWTDGDFPVGATDQFAEVATSDPHAFICPVVGDSMFPRFMPGEYVLVEPSTPIDIENEVLVRLNTGETMLKRLLSRRDEHVRLGSWNDPTIFTYREDELTWMYYVAHAVPTKKIKSRF